MKKRKIFCAEIFLKIIHSKKIFYFKLYEIQSSRAHNDTNMLTHKMTFDIEIPLFFFQYVLLIWPLISLMMMIIIIIQAKLYGFVQIPTCSVYKLATQNFKLIIINGWNECNISLSIKIIGRNENDRSLIHCAVCTECTYGVTWWIRSIWIRCGFSWCVGKHGFIFGRLYLNHSMHKPTYTRHDMHMQTFCWRSCVRVWRETQTCCSSSSRLVFESCLTGRQICHFD